MKYRIGFRNGREIEIEAPSDINLPRSMGRVIKSDLKATSHWLETTDGLFNISEITYVLPASVFSAKEEDK